MPLLILIALAVTGWLAVTVRTRRLRQAGMAFLTRFEALPALGAYREGLTRFGTSNQRHKHAVLLIHGFSASPAAFGPLLEALDQQGVPYLAPALTGFGLADFRLLEAARATDWRRDVRVAYDQLAAQAEEVSVIAISFGTLLATELALVSPVRRLVLVSPYFHLKSAGDRRSQALLARPWLRALALTLMPYIAKPVRPGRTVAGDIADPAAAARFFQYPTLPLSSLLEVWDFPTRFPLQSLRCRTLDVLYGELDLTSDVETFLAGLAARAIPHASRGFKASGHNLFSDADALEATQVAASLLTVAD